MTAIKLTSYARLSYALTSLTEVNNLNAAINSSDYWLLAFNCSCFARYCWNAVAPNSMQLTGSTPLLLKSSILSHGGMTSGIVDYQKPDNTIAYHTPTGYVIFPAGKNSDIFLGENE